MRALAGAGAHVVGPDDRRIRGVMPYAVDPDAARRLWAISAGLTGVDAISGPGGDKG